MSDLADEFLSKFHKLDQQTLNEDLTRSQTFKSNSNNDIFLPRPIARSSIPYSDSTNDFNAKLSSDEYRVHVDQLEYESAYNYEKSTSPLRESNFSSSSTYSKRAKDLPDIIKFDDFITTRPYRPSNNKRYSKFQLTDDEKSEMDKTLSQLIGSPNNVTQPTQKPLTRDHKGGTLSPDWLSAVNTKPKPTPPNNTTLQPNLFNESELTTSKVRRPTDHRLNSSQNKESNELKKSPRKFDLSSPTRVPSQTSPIRKSPARLNISQFTDKPELKPKSTHWKDSVLDHSNTTTQKSQVGNSATSTRNSWLSSAQGKNPAPVPTQAQAKNLNINKDQKNAWLNSVIEKSSSTPQGQSTESNFQVKPQPNKNSWLDSVIEKSTSTPQAQSTESNFQLNTSSQSNKNSWLDSAKKNTPIRPSKSVQIKKLNVSHSKDNTLADALSKFENLEIERTSTLKELNSTKLNHINPPKITPIINLKPKEEDLKLKDLPVLNHVDSQSSNEADSSDDAFKPITLKKTRAPTIPIKPNNLTDLEFLQAKLASSSSGKESEKRKVSEPEALKRSKNLKPPLPKRKPSLQKLEILEVKLKNSNLDDATPRQIEQPEGLQKLQNLKPSKPVRKPSIKELEALESLKKIKNKESSNKSVPPKITPKSERVVSQSKDLLKSQLGRLKSVKNESPTNTTTTTTTTKKAQNINELENLILRRAQTNPNPISNQSNSFPSVKKASTFNESELPHDSKLVHLNKKRNKGPKRRTPKTINE